MRIATTLTLLALAFFLVDNSLASSIYGEKDHLILGLKSLWQGFNRGFYKRSGKIAMSDTCINQETLDHYYNFMAIWYALPEAKGDYITSLGDIAHVVANICDCNFGMPLTDISNQCFPKSFVEGIEVRDFKCNISFMGSNLIE